MTDHRSSLVSFRMQMWHAIGEKLKWSDSEAEWVNSQHTETSEVYFIFLILFLTNLFFLSALKVISGRCMSLCSHIKHLQQVSSFDVHSPFEVSLPFYCFDSYPSVFWFSNRSQNSFKMKLQKCRRTDLVCCLGKKCIIFFMVQVLIYELFLIVG